MPKKSRSRLGEKRGDEKTGAKKKKPTRRPENSNEIGERKERNGMPSLYNLPKQREKKGGGAIQPIGATEVKGMGIRKGGTIKPRKKKPGKEARTYEFYLRIHRQDRQSGDGPCASR